MPADDPILVKKYGNRRLYDTDESRYITLDELAKKIEGGASVRVIDAKTKRDLTQATLTQIIIEGRGLAKLLPVGLLEQLIRLGDDALAEFFGRWVVSALDVYLQAKRGVRGMTAWNPFAQVPFAAQDALARMWMSTPFASAPPDAPPAAPPAPMDSNSSKGADELAELRKEIEELKDAVLGASQRKKKKGSR